MLQSAAIQVLLICFGLEVGFGLECNSSNPHSLKFSIASRKNSTGHWMAQVQFEHGAGPKEAGPWEVDIVHTTAKCDVSESVLIEATVTAPPQRPGQNYELVPALGYYKLHTKGATWHQAVQICNQEGAHLVVLNSDLEARTLSVMWQAHPKLFSDWRNDWAFVGAHDINVEGEYVTIFDQPLNNTGFSKWQSGQPNGGDCLVMFRGPSTLGDVSCTDVLAYFCEQEL